MAFDNTYVSLEQNTPHDAYVNLQPSIGSSTPLPMEATDERAAKAHFVMGPDRSPGLDALKLQFASGGEDNVRMSMADQKDQENQTNVTKALNKVTAINGDLTPEDVDFTMKMMKTKPSDPSTILETEYGRKFASFATTIKPEYNQVFSKAWKYEPATTAFELNLTSNTVAKGSIAQSILQEYQARWDKTKLLESVNGEDIALNAYVKSLIPFVPWYVMHNQLQGMKTESILPGNNLSEQIQSAWLIADPTEFHRMAKASIEDAWQRSPLQALILASGLVGFSNSDQLLGNIYGMADIAVAVPFGTVSKVAKGMVARATGNLTSKAPIASERVLGEFNPYRYEPDRVGPTSELLPQSVRDNGRVIARGEEPLKEGYTRLYRAEGAVEKEKPEWVAQAQKESGHADAEGRWYTEDRSALDWYHNNTNGYSRTAYVDVKTSELDKYRVANNEQASKFSRDPSNEFFLNEDVLQNKKYVKPPEGPVMNAKRGQTFDINRGPTMQTERGAAWEVPSQEVSDAVRPARDLNLPLRGPAQPSRLPQLEGDVSRDQFMNAWARYYRANPWNAASDVLPSGEFPAALLPKGQTGTSQEIIDQSRKAFWDVVKAGNEPKPDIERTLAFIGDIPTAARIGASRMLSAVTSPTLTTAPQTNLYELSKDLPSVFNPMVYTASPGNFSREQASRLATTLLERGQGFMDQLTGKVSIERLTPEAQEKAFQEADKTIRTEHHNLNDYVFDVVRNPRDPLKNTDSVSLLLGNKGGNFFETSDAAKLFAKDVFKLPDGSYSISQQGIGFYVNVARPIDETLGAVRDAIATTKYSQTPANLISNLLFGTWSPRSAADLLSPYNRAQREVATHAPQDLRAFFLDNIKDISSLPNKQRKEVQDVLRDNRDYQHPVTRERGQFYQTIGDFQNAFIARHSKIPNEAQTQAYFTFVQLSDMDWMLRNFGWLRDKERLGIQLHNFKVNGATTDWLEGKLLRDIPNSAEDAGFLLSRDGRNPIYVRRHDPEFSMQEINNLLQEEHYHAIQIANPTERPLMAATGEKDIINFVITNTKETKGLSWKQAEYRPGGHVMYPYEWFVKQPQIAVGRGGRTFYYGDTSIFNFSSEKEASMWAQRMDIGRELLAKNDPNLGAYVTQNLPYTETDFRGLFNNYLDKDLPISHSQTGKSSVQTDTRLVEIDHLKNLRNDLDSSYNLYNQLDRTYLADRDMQLGTISPTGSKLKPWQIESAPAVDPFPMMNRSLGQAIRSRTMSDYKIAAAEEWVEQFKHLMTAPEEALRRNPLSALYNANFAKIADKTVSREELMAAENARSRIIDFVGSQNEFERNMTRVESIIADAAYTSLGKSGADYVTANLLPNVKDPSAYFRSIAFHSKLGLFNPVQLFVQAQSMFNSIAIAGVQHGGKGAMAGILQRYLALTEESGIIDKAAQFSRAFGWTPEEFKESYQTFQKTGVWHVAGETAWRDDVTNPNLFKSTAGSFLDKGAVFFANGERQVRLTAWNTAFSEWKEANAGREVLNRDIGDIMRRADDLSGNMTRASNANWQKGIFSIPSQFLTYNARMAELFIGGRLTIGEKARALTTFSALYGIPVGVGAMTGVLPLYEDVRKEALLRGYPDVDSSVYKAFGDGLVSLAVSAAFGKDYNIAQRYGPNGTQLFEDALKGNKTVPEVLGGASYAVMRDIAKTTYPFFSHLSSYVMGDKSKAPLLLDDFIAGTENISTASNVTKTLYGLYTGNYITKNRVNVGGLTTMDSLLISTLGLTPTKIQDVFYKEAIMKDLKKYQDDQTKEALISFRNGIEAGQKGNTDTMNAHFKQGQATLESAGLDPLQRSKIMSQIMKSNPIESMTKINNDFIQKAPIQYRQQLIDNMLHKRGAQQ